MTTDKDVLVAARAVAEGNDAFGMKIYSSVSKEEGGNLVISPCSASSVMAMATVGARGETKEEMREGMHFPEVEEMLKGYSHVFGVLRGDENFTLETAHRLFVQEGYELMEDFVNDMKETFHAEAAQTDFADSEVARKFINAYVEEKTKEKIKDLIPDGVLNEKTKLVLVNAIYFKATHASKFDKKNTIEADFHLEEGKVVKAQMMHKYESMFKMTEVENLNSQLIELPYKGDQISMLILLPTDKFGLADLEKKLSQIKLGDLFSQIDAVKKDEVDIVIPKFRLEKTIDLKSHLKKLGMARMFSDEKADFSGINGDTDLYVSAVLQKAFIEFNEEGSEAAAATAIVVDEEATGDFPSPEFICDHPFIFFIRDKLTDMVLFQGRVVDPTVSEENDNRSVKSDNSSIKSDNSSKESTNVSEGNDNSSVKSDNSSKESTNASEGNDNSSVKSDNISKASNNLSENK